MSDNNGQKLDVKIAITICCNGCGNTMKSTAAQAKRALSGAKCYCGECRRFGVVSLEQKLKRIV